MPSVLSPIARKGGVGKASTALSLAGAALDDGLSRWPWWNLDSQASLSRAILGSIEAIRLSGSAQALTDGVPAESLFQPTQTQGMSILPAHPDLRLPTGTLL